MSNYRRWRIPGGTYFFTVVTYRRRPLFSSPPARAALRSAIRAVRAERPFHIDAIVLLPDHLHVLMTLPHGDDGYSTRLRQIKDRFTRSFLAIGGTEAALTPSRRKRRERGVWQRRFWEHAVGDEDDFERHFDYIHFNPVKHGYARHPVEWPFSTFHRWVSRGVYPPEWGRDAPPRFGGLDESAVE